MHISKNEGEASIKALYDTGGALNTGNLTYHTFIKDKIPGAVKRYEEFNGSNPFDPIKLSGALLDPGDYDVDKHGILSTVITYHTPFKSVSGDKISLSFALGRDMSVDIIIGLPFIKEMRLELRFSPEMFLSHTLKKEFLLVYIDTALTLPDEKVIDESETTKGVSFKHDVKSTVEPLTPIIQGMASGTASTSIEK